MEWRFAIPTAYTELYIFLLHLSYCHHHSGWVPPQSSLREPFGVVIIFVISLTLDLAFGDFPHHRWRKVSMSPPGDTKGVRMRT